MNGTDSSIDAFLEDIRRHREARDRRMRSPTGWLALAARWPLVVGNNEIDIGVAIFTPDEVVVRPRSGVAMSDAAGVAIDAQRWRWREDTEPVFFVGERRYSLLVQGDRAAIRVHDPNSPTLTEFRGLDAFPPNPTYRVQARLEPARTPRTIPLLTGLGAEVALECPGTLAFELRGQTHRLDPLFEEAGAKRLFLLFHDTTNGHGTYGAGRFLYIDLPDERGLVTIDFNKAFNPPCALTEFAACPVVPPQNRLSIPIEAGERV